MLTLWARVWVREQEEPLQVHCPLSTAVKPWWHHRQAYEHYAVNARDRRRQRHQITCSQKEQFGRAKIATFILWRIILSKSVTVSASFFGTILSTTNEASQNIVNGKLLVFSFNFETNWHWICSSYHLDHRLRIHRRLLAPSPAKTMVLLNITMDVIIMSISQNIILASRLQ